MERRGEKTETEVYYVQVPNPTVNEVIVHCKPVLIKVRKTDARVDIEVNKISGCGSTCLSSQHS